MIKHLAIGALMAVGATSAAQAQDAAAGEKIFARCKACHVVGGEQNKVGPHLSGIIGRKAGSVEGYKYSAAMTKAGEEGKVWDEAALSEYLANPKQVVSGTKMAFAGLKKEEDVKNVIAYLKEAGG